MDANNMVPPAQPELKQAIEDGKKNIKSIIKMQGIVRGYLQRKVNKIANDIMDPKPQMSNRSR